MNTNRHERGVPRIEIGKDHGIPCGLVMPFQHPRDNYILAMKHDPCAYCGLKPSLTIDHITPLSRGGGNGTDNFAGVCADCNNLKGKKSPLRILYQAKYRCSFGPNRDKPLMYIGDRYG